MSVQLSAPEAWGESVTVSSTVVHLHQEVSLERLMKVLASNSIEVEEAAKRILINLRKSGHFTALRRPQLRLCVEQVQAPQQLCELQHSLEQKYRGVIRPLEPSEMLNTLHQLVFEEGVDSLQGSFFFLDYSGNMSMVSWSLAGALWYAAWRNSRAP